MAEQVSTVHPAKPLSPKAHQNHPKPFPSFLYKVILVLVLIALLPISPSSQALENSSKSILARGWELLHLLVVGIAISYGVFSRRNSEPEIEKETQLKGDMPQSYVSQILHVSSVFDDEVIESPKGVDFADRTKNQTWKYSQYYPEEPVVMVAKGAPNSNNSSTKPLVLPVRSLKSSSFSAADETYEEVGDLGESGGKEGAVLPSPIPWRSRSGRMEVKQESSPPSYSPPKLASFEREFSHSRTPSFRSSTQSSSGSPSPKRVLSPSPSLSPELRGKISEDYGRRKSFHRSSPPPAPPPPPVPLTHSSHPIYERRDARKSFKDELQDFSRRGRNTFLERNDAGSYSFNSEKDPYVARSVGTVRSQEAQDLPPQLSRNPSEKKKKKTKKKNEFMERMIITSDSGSDDDEYDDGELSDSLQEEASTTVSPEVVPEENEVDKKADEFIAKFREQIRLQRIASLKKSTGQRNTRNSK